MKILDFMFPAFVFHSIVSCVALFNVLNSIHQECKFMAMLQKKNRLTANEAVLSFFILLLNRIQWINGIFWLNNSALLQFAVPATVGKIDYEPDDEPYK